MNIKYRLIVEFSKNKKLIVFLYFIKEYNGAKIWAIVDRIIVIQYKAYYDLTEYASIGINKLSIVPIPKRIISAQIGR